MFIKCSKLSGLSNWKWKIVYCSVTQWLRSETRVDEDIQIFIICEVHLDIIMNNGKLYDDYNNYEKNSMLCVLINDKIFLLKMYQCLCTHMCVWHHYSLILFF